MDNKLILPPAKPIASYVHNPPVPSPELIPGILRQGHKLTITGPAKLGKSYLVMDLALAISSGSDWLGWSCEQGRVLYVNLELDDASCYHRFATLAEAKNYDLQTAQIDVCHLRGHVVSMDTLANHIINMTRDNGINYALIIIDPIYKLIDGDENSSQVISSFCAQLDRICQATGSAVAIVHHHSKRATTHTAMHRGSGSGVIARDADALIDFTLDKKNKSIVCVDCTLREFASPPPIYITATLPHFARITDFVPTPIPTKTKKDRYAVYRGKLDQAYAYCTQHNIPARLDEISRQLGCSSGTIRNWVAKDTSEAYYIKKNRLYRAHG